jgi:D-alanyl-D-alanine carboxypeptidase
LTGSYRDQHWTQDSDGVKGEGETGDTFGNALTAGDFNGDGFADLAVGAPTEDLDGADAAGVVHVLYGSASGLQAAGDQLWMQGSDGLSDSPEDEDWFGRSLTTGDFNDDGFADLAIGVYHESINGDESAGAVHVLYGSASGLSAAAGPGEQFIHQDLAWMENQAEPTDSFGLPLASGDINGDGFADLVVGVAVEDFGATVNVGALQVIYGSAAGLGPQNQFLRQGLIEPENLAFNGNPEAGDGFGWSLAVGDFNNDGFADVATGVPYENLENIGMDDAGAVHVFYGTASGLTTAGHELWTDGLPETGDNYGFALTAGDFDSDGFADLAIGMVNENVDNNTITDAGSVYVLYGSATGLGYAHDGLFYQGAGGITDAAEEYNKFGRVLASGDLNGDGALDLVVGIPDETLNEGTDDVKYDAGAIHVIYGSATDGLTDDANKLWWQGTQRRVHALLTDVQREENYGEGGGALFTQIPTGEPLTNHIASVTKVMTLLLAAEALEAPASAFALDDEVTISALAAGTGGSRMANAADEVLATNDVMRLELLLYGMMLRSCNKSSVAIAQHFTGTTADFVTFSNWMNLKAAELNMSSTLYTHPAGGCITTPQDQVNLWLEGWQHPLFRQISTDRYYTGPHTCGEDADGAAKCFFGVEKLGDSGYPGLEGWKGGNGRLGPSLGRPSCTSSLLGQATRVDRTLVVSLHQTGDRWGDNDRMLDYGYQYLFTPDNRGANVLAGTVVSDFAVRRVTDTVTVTAVIDGQNNLRLDTWQVMASLGQVEPLAAVVMPVNDLAKGTNSLRATLVDMTPLPTVGEAEGDYLTGYLSNGQLRLDVWRVGAEPGY